MNHGSNLIRFGTIFLAHNDFLVCKFTCGFFELIWVNNNNPLELHSISEFTKHSHVILICLILLKTLLRRAWIIIFIFFTDDKLRLKEIMIVPKSPSKRPDPGLEPIRARTLPITEPYLSLVPRPQYHYLTLPHT